MKNFVDLYFSETKSPAIQQVKQIPMKHVQFILSLKGFNQARTEVDTVNNYLLNMHQDSSKPLDAQSTVSSKSFSIASSIFKENKLTYDTFLELLKDPNPSKLNKQAEKEKIGFKKHKGTKGEKQMDIEEPVKAKKDTTDKDWDKMDFMTKIENINEILIRILTARINPSNPDFNIKTLVVSMTDTTKYNAFKRLAGQTAQVIEARTTHQPEILKSLRLFNYPGAFIFKSNPSNVEVIVDQPDKKSELAENLFNNGLRIIMYDKIIKSGFSHLSIFLDDFNYIYNEVITSTNEMASDDINLEQINKSKNKSIFGEDNKATQSRTR